MMNLFLFSKGVEGGFVGLRLSIVEAMKRKQETFVHWKGTFQSQTCAPFNLVMHNTVYVWYLPLLVL
jgi:hypothetical protein